MTRDFLFDIAKIVEGAANGDYEKVVAYVESLGGKLENAGDHQAAKRIRQILGKSKASQVTLARAGSNSPLPIDSESRIPVADEEKLYGKVPVYLSRDASKSIEQFLTFFRAADRLVANGVGISPSLLMYGPPGCGKTQVAKHIASELGYPLITARSDALISSYLGSTAKNLRLLFEHAASRPCVLFLDEFDAIAKMRDDDRELGELKRVVISLMQNIDAMGRDHVLLAATNHEHLLDPAIWRRFSYKLNLKEPDHSARKEMLAHFFSSFADNEMCELMAAITSGLSGARLRDIAEDAIRSAVLENKTKIEVLGLIQNIVGSSSVDDQVVAINKAAPSITQTKLAEIFNKSQSTISAILKRSKYHAA